MTLGKFAMNWWKELRGRVKLNEPLENYTTLKIAGRAKFFIEPKDINDLKLLLSLLRRYKIPLRIIGAGSNILVSDKGVDAAVIRLDSPYFNRLSLKNGYLEVGSGVGLNEVVLATQRRGLSGVEFLAGIPGTIGGALAMNAGIPQANIAQTVKDITVMDYYGNIKTLNKKDIKFSYRSSHLSRYIILSARLKLVKKNKRKIKDEINKYLNYRHITQDLSLPSCGCIFKNPRGDSAGRLIDLCGLKGKRIGDAFVSLKHANFILNLGNAKAGDVFKLMDLIKKKVKKRFNVTLEPEIKIWR